MKFLFLVLVMMSSAWAQDMELIEEGLNNPEPTQALNCAKPKPQHPGKKYTKELFEANEALRVFFQTSAQKKDLYDRVVEIRKGTASPERLQSLSEFKKWNQGTGSYFCFVIKEKANGQFAFAYKTLSCQSK